MRASEAINVLSHLPPNTPTNVERPFSDKRFSKMWCPFHGEQRVPMLVYQPHKDEVVFTCYEACRDQQWIYSTLRARYFETEYDSFFFSVVVSDIRTGSRRFRLNEFAVLSMDLKKWVQEPVLV